MEFSSNSNHKRTLSATVLQPSDRSNQLSTVAVLPSGTSVLEQIYPTFHSHIQRVRFNEKNENDLKFMEN